MKLARRLLTLALALPLALPLAAPLAEPAWAGDGIEVVHPWARPTIPNRPGVVYLGIHNLGDSADRLVGVRAEGVGEAELHQSRQTDEGLMVMTPVEAVEIPAGGMAHLGPGGYHIMLLGIEEPLKAGDSLSLTLEFEQAGEVAVTVPVMRDDPAPHGQEGHGMHHQGDDQHGGSGD